MDKFDMELIEQLEDQASALAPGIMASAVAERPETKAVALIHDQAAEIVRLEAERDNAERCAVTEIGQRQQVEDHNATMRTALEKIRPNVGQEQAAIIDAALATDAGKSAADVIEAAQKAAQAFAIWEASRRDDNAPTDYLAGRLVEANRNQVKAISALNASRTEGQDNG